MLSSYVFWDLAFAAALGIVAGVAFPVVLLLQRRMNLLGRTLTEQLKSNLLLLAIVLPPSFAVVFLNYLGRVKFQVPDPVESAQTVITSVCALLVVAPLCFLGSGLITKELIKSFRR